MWVFDGEEWVNEGGDSTSRREIPDLRHPFDEEPELRVIPQPLRKTETTIPLPTPRDETSH